MAIRFPSRRTLVLLAVGCALVAVASVALLRTRDGDAQPAGLGTQTVTVGAVDVTMTALALGTSGAQFRLTLDTHAASLELDLTSASELRVAGRLAEAGTWDGAGPGGHHREGTLSFTTPVPAGAAVELRLTGLPGDAVATWTAP